MIKRQLYAGEKVEKKFKGLVWVKWIVIGLVILIISGLVVREWRSSQIVENSQYRFNMAMIAPDSGIAFISFDPAEKSILVIPFPTNLAINSRSKGEYLISSLYKLGSYSERGGMFARQKIQGFMRVPIPGYLVVKDNVFSQSKDGVIKEKIKSKLLIGLLRVILSPGKTDTSMSRFDAIMLFYRASRYGYREVGEDELLRAGIIDKNIYHPERLQEYVGTRLFDWGIGAGGVTVAIVNASGENGLGSDMADFLSNLGMDVVMVRSSKESEPLEVSQWQVADKKVALNLQYIFQNLFEFGTPKLENVAEEYRAQVLIRVGKDARDLF